MRRGFGWIEPLQAIEHQNAHLHNGRIYLDAEDMRPGVALRPGDLVVFFLYADSQGLGAEDCFPVRNTQANRKRESPRSYPTPPTSCGGSSASSSLASSPATTNSDPSLLLNNDADFDE